MKSVTPISARPFALTGHLFFLLMGVMAYVFYLERGSTFDDAQYFVVLSKGGTFTFPHDRYGAILPQLFTVLGIKLGLSLKPALILYSLSYVIAGWAIWSFIHYVAKSVWVGFAFVFSQLILTQVIFFWPVSEGLQASQWAFLVLGVLVSDRLRLPWKLVLGIVFSGLAIFTHPTAIFMLLAAYTTAYWAGEERPFFAGGLRILLWTGVAILILVLKGFSPYETEVALDWEEIQKRIPNFSQGGNLDRLLDGLWSTYLPLLLSFFGGVMGMIWRRRYYAGVSLALLGIAYWLLAMLTFFYGRILAIIHQNSLIPLAFIAAILIVVALERFWRIKEVLYGVTIVMSIMMVVRIVNALPYIEARFTVQKQLEDYIRQFPEKKAVLWVGNFEESTIDAAWSTCKETMIRTSIQTPDDPVVISIVHDFAIFDRPGWDVGSIPGPDFWAYFSYNEFNTEFFPIKDTRYRFLSSDSCQVQEIRPQIKVELIGLDSVLDTRLAQVVVRITNIGDVPVCSATKERAGGWMKYWFINPGGEMVEDRELDIRLNHDLHPGKTMEQTIWMETNLGRGNYIFSLSVNDAGGYLGKVEVPLVLR